MLTQKDICLVIPTYNRAADVERTLSTLIKNKNIPGRVILVDQSKNNDTKVVANKYAKKFSLKYIYSSKPSSSIAENIGVKEAKKAKFKLILITGDDIDFLPGYMNALKGEFENPKVMGVGGVDQATEHITLSFKDRILNIFLASFFLPHQTKNKFKIVGPYGNTTSLLVTEKVVDAEWIPGMNNCFRKEIYDEYSFPEIKGYNVLEDIDCSYKVFKKYGKGSLVISPKCKIIHRLTEKERYPEKKRIFANHEDHFTFYYRNFYTLSGTFKFIWSIFGIIIGNTTRLILSPSKKSLFFLQYSLQGIWFAYKNKEKIKKGNYRSFLNEDLSMKF